MSERDGEYTSIFTGRKFLRLTAKRIIFSSDGTYRFLDIEFGDGEYLKIEIDPSTTEITGFHHDEA